MRCQSQPGGRNEADNLSAAGSANHGWKSAGAQADLTDANGSVTAGYGYDVFGALRGQSGSSDKDFEFTGEQLDAE